MLRGRTAVRRGGGAEPPSPPLLRLHVFVVLASVSLTPFTTILAIAINIFTATVGHDWYPASDAAHSHPNGRSSITCSRSASHVLVCWRHR
jgi:hypothetical protein